MVVVQAKVRSKFYDPDEKMAESGVRNFFISSGTKLSFFSVTFQNTCMVCVLDSAWTKKVFDCLFWRSLLGLLYFPEVLKNIALVF